jgi:hypothetical protein
MLAVQECRGRLQYIHVTDLDVAYLEHA